MKTVTANGKKKIVMTRKEWKAIGKKAGWDGENDEPTTPASAPDSGVEWDKVPSTVPPLVVKSLKNYVENRVKPGGFLSAVLANNLKAAIMSADPQSLAGLKSLVMFIYDYIPGNCHGSYQDMNRWLSSGGR